MSVSAETLSVLVFLIPGFFSSLILNALVVRPSPSNLRYLIEGLIFSFFTYIIVFVWTDVWPVSLRPETVDDTVFFVVDFNAGVLWQVAGLSVVLPVLLGFSITHDCHMEVLRWLNLTNLTARQNVWLDVFSNHGDRLIIVELADGRRVIGWPMYYSDNNDDQSLYLRQAAWVIGDGKYTRIPGHGLFIVKRDYIKTIHFHSPPERKEDTANGNQTGRSAKESEQ